MSFFSGVMGIVYGLYYFNPTSVICVANSADFTPTQYNHTSDVDSLLDRPGTSNVTDEFYQVIAYGFFQNIAFFTFVILFDHIVQREKYNVTYLFFYVAFKVSEIAQFTLLYIYRYSHVGKVCAGDYKKFVLNEEGNPDNSFDKYFLKSEGNFFYYYSMILIWIFFILFSLASVGGIVVMLMGAAESLSNIEEFVKNMDSIPEMMKKHQEGQFNRYSSQ